MRKIILVAAAMVLASASAQAGGPRGLSLASTNEQASAPQTHGDNERADAGERSSASRRSSEISRSPARDFAHGPCCDRADHDDLSARYGPTRREVHREGGQAEAQAQLDRRPHHRRAASPRHLPVRVIAPKKHMAGTSPAMTQEFLI
ncbi:hypothetical protein ACVW1A_002695 [Bradyrhizobium sp. LB1.3]